MAGKQKINLDLLRIYLKQNKSQAECSRLFKVSQCAVSKARRKLEAIVPAREPSQDVQAPELPKDPVPPEPVIEREEPEPQQHGLYTLLDRLDGRLEDNSKEPPLEMDFYERDREECSAGLNRRPGESSWGWMKG